VRKNFWLVLLFLSTELRASQFGRLLVQIVPGVACIKSGLACCPVLCEHGLLQIYLRRKCYLRTHTSFFSPPNVTAYCLTICVLSLIDLSHENNWACRDLLYKLLMTDSYFLLLDFFPVLCLMYSIEKEKFAGNHVCECTIGLVVMDL